MSFFTSRTVSRALDVAIGVATLAPPVYLAAQYEEMPAYIPVHWNIRGEVDRWVSRGLISVFFPSILAASLQLLFGMLTHDLLSALGRVRDSGDEARARASSLGVNLELIQLIRVVLVVLLTLVVVSLPLSQVEGRSPAWWPHAMGGSVVALLLIVLSGVVRIWIAQERWEAAASPSLPQLREDHWRWGRSIYFNASDDEFIVHKRVGSGFTLNFAHPRAKRYLALFVFILGFVVVAVTTSL